MAKKIRDLFENGFSGDTVLIISGFAQRAEDSTRMESDEGWTPHEEEHGVWKPANDGLILVQRQLSREKPLFSADEGSAMAAWTRRVCKVSMSTIKALKRDIIATEKELSRKKRDLGAHHLVVTAARATMAERFNKMLEALSKDPRVDSVRITGNKVVLLTQDVWHEVPAGRRNEGAHYFLGKFEFHVSLTDGIKFRNLKLNPTGDGRVHPHGWESSVCLGTYESTIANCFGCFDNHWHI